MKNFIYQNKIWLGIILCLILIIIGSSITFIYYYFYEQDDNCISETFDVAETLLIEEDIEEETEEINYVYIDVKGAVENPGVYKIEEGSIINDAINLAGGLTKSAVTSNINLSKLVTNEMVVYVFKESDYETENVCEVVSLTEEATSDSSIKSEEIYIDDSTDNNESVIEPGDSENSSDSTSSGLVNLNTASVDELMTLSGIGESKALAIIEYRETQVFTSVEELKNISGIGDSTFDAIKDLITV